MKKKWVDVALKVIENLLFAVGLFLAVPPVASDPSSAASFAPDGLVAVILFAVARALGEHRERPAYISAGFQAAGFLIFVMMIFQRVQIR